MKKIKAVDSVLAFLKRRKRMKKSHLMAKKFLLPLQRKIPLKRDHVVLALVAYVKALSAIISSGTMMVSNSSVI